MYKVVSFIVAVLLCVFWTSDAAWADSDCPKERPLTAAEQAFFGHFAVLRAAVPPVPAGWEFSPGSQKRMASDYNPAPANQCTAYPDHNLGLAVTYDRKTTQAEVDAATRASNVAPDPAQQEKIQKLMAQQEALLKSMQTAVQKGDNAAMQKLNAQAEALGKQLNAAQHKAYEPMIKATAAFSHDREATVELVVNGTDAHCYGNPEAVKIPDATAFRCANPDNFDTDGNVVDPAAAQMIIILGQAATNIDGWTRHTRDGKAVPDKVVTVTPKVDANQPLKVQDVVVTISSDNAKRVAQLYQGLKLDGLRKLVSQ